MDACLAAKQVVLVVLEAKVGQRALHFPVSGCVRVIVTGFSVHYMRLCAPLLKQCAMPYGFAMVNCNEDALALWTASAVALWQHGVRKSRLCAIRTCVAHYPDAA
jgi:hypothetical protein